MLNKNLGPLMVDVDGFELTAEDKEVLEHPSVSGVIIFSKNFHDIDQLTHLNAEIKNLKTKNKSNNNQLLIAVDQEGGPVQRIKDPLTTLPPMTELGKYYEYDQESALQMAKKLGWLLATELLTIGFDFSFTPVVDLNLCDNNIIKERSFHKKPNVVSDLALALKSGLNHAGMAAVAKHFPGHGGVLEDSHEITPIDNRTYDEIGNNDLIPFKKLIKDNIESIMTSHILFPNIDKNIVSFSEFWLKDILREKLNFNGLIISDDLNMNGADFIVKSKTGEKLRIEHTDRVLNALGAGCELILLCNNREAVIKTLDDWKNIDWRTGDNYSKKIDSMRAKGGTPSPISKLHNNKNWHNAVAELDKLAQVVG